MYYLHASLEAARNESKGKYQMPPKINQPPIMVDTQQLQGKNSILRSPEFVRESNDVNLESPGAQSLVAKIEEEKQQPTGEEEMIVEVELAKD